MSRGGWRDGGRPKIWESVENPEEEMITVRIPKKYKDRVLLIAKQWDKEDANKKTDNPGRKAS